MTDSDLALAGTPYLIGQDDAAKRRYRSLLETSTALREQALASNERIRDEANELLEPYLNAIRTELVAESNVMEGMSWTASEAREAVLKNRELLDGPTRTLVDSVRSDSRVYQVLGLYQAHRFADQWRATDQSPTAKDIRAIHQLILGSVPGSGSYKRLSNAIGGTSHRTAEPEDVPRVMLELADWWRQGAGDPILTATVVHAWLAHAHPFDDGNGRTARVLANLELARNGYPPLVIRPESDRGQYYAALADSDAGDILPLYELFVHAVRRQVRLMAKPRYVLDLIEDKFLTTERDRHRFWIGTVTQFSIALKRELEAGGATYAAQGLPDHYSFSLLCDRDSGGNAWFATIGRSGHLAEWLLWFGYRTTELLDMAPKDRPYPSVFVSRRDNSPEAIHPFTRTFDSSDLRLPVPDEVGIVPAVSHPVSFRTRFDLDAFTIETAAKRLASALSAVV